MGIYRIKCLANGKFYIGSSSNLNKRRQDHFSGLRRKNHFNVYLQRTFDKHGEENFIWEILELVEDINILKTREQYWINYYNSFDKEIGFNLVPLVETHGTLGYKYTDEQKEKQLKVLEEKVWARKRKTFEFIDPDGNYRKIHGLRQFCIKNDLSYKTMLNIHIGIGNTCMGWRKFFHDGTIKNHKGKDFVLIHENDSQISGDNLKQFCKDNNLSYENLRKGCKSNGWIWVEKFEKRINK